MSENQSERPQEVIEAAKHDVSESNETRQTEAIAREVTHIIESKFSGPLPPPNIIGGYEEVVPGSAERIIALAERQSAHRQDMERIIIKAESRDSFLGVFFAFILGIGCLIASVVMVVMVPQSAGAISSAFLGATGIGAIIITFIKSTRSNNNQQDDESE